MSYYDVVCKGVPCRFEIGGDWNRKFRESSSDRECAQAVIPVWTACEDFMRYLTSLPGTSRSSDRSVKAIIDKRMVIVTYVNSSKMRGFWLSCDSERLVYTWAEAQPVFIWSSSSRWAAWFMDHCVDLEAALLASDSDEDSLDRLPDDPRYLIRVGRKSREIEDGEMDRITIKEVK